MKQSRSKLRAGVWLLAALLALVVGVPTCFSVSATRSLDRSLAHTHATEALPMFTPGGPDGLVRIEARGFVFRARVAGLANRGPALMLLHGWPETSAMWQPLVDAASARGFRVVAFDQRGYSPGARPEAVADYRVPYLLGDVLAAEEGLERGKVVRDGSIVARGTARRGFTAASTLLKAV